MDTFRIEETAYMDDGSIVGPAVRDHNDMLDASEITWALEGAKETAWHDGGIACHNIMALVAYRFAVVNVDTGETTRAVLQVAGSDAINGAWACMVLPVFGHAVPSHLKPRVGKVQIWNVESIAHKLARAKANGDHRGLML